MARTKNPLYEPKIGLARKNRAKNIIINEATRPAFLTTEFIEKYKEQGTGF